MSITAKRGEYQITKQVHQRTVASYPRTFGITFSPSSSLSRMHIIDSGERYEVRLNKGLVEIRLRGGIWKTIQHGKDPYTGENLPWGISYLNKRLGDALEPVQFDMIAVGRGRILAKEKGTDRLFHVKLNDLFRTHNTVDSNIFDLWRPLKKYGDPPVPGSCYKLDPEFFTPPDGSSTISSELRRNYASHPASLRFSLFVEAMKTEMSDGMVVPVKSRVWQLIDSRSPLAIFELDDFKCIDDNDFKQLATKNKIRQILNQIYRSKKDEIEGGIDDWVEELIKVDLTPSIPLPAPIDSGINDIKNTLDDLDDYFFDFLEPIPWLGDVVRFLRNLISDARSGIVALTNTISASIEHLAEDIVSNTAKRVAHGIVPFIIDSIASEAHNIIHNRGLGALFYPGVIALGLLTEFLTQKGAIKNNPTKVK
ncbi:MAG: hypothetical protein QM706_17720 [Nitrospira sp.]